MYEYSTTDFHSLSIGEVVHNWLHLDNEIKNFVKITKEREMFVKDAKNVYIRHIKNVIQQDGYTIIIIEISGYTTKHIVKTYKKDIFNRELGLMMCLAKYISSCTYDGQRKYRDLKKCFANGRHSKKNLEINKALVKGFILQVLPLKEYDKILKAFKEKYND